MEPTAPKAFIFLTDFLSFKRSILTAAILKTEERGKPVPIMNKNSRVKDKHKGLGTI